MTLPTAKRTAKHADWIVANDVSGDVMGGARNRVHLVTAAGVEDWPQPARPAISIKAAEVRTSLFIESLSAFSRPRDSTLSGAASRGEERYDSR